MKINLRRHNPAYIRSIDLANTILREHFRNKYQPTVAELLTDVHTINNHWLERTGHPLCSEPFDTQTGTLPTTTAHLKSKFTNRRGTEPVTQYIVDATNTSHRLTSWRLRRLIRQTIR